MRFPSKSCSLICLIVSTFLVPFAGLASAQTNYTTTITLAKLLSGGSPVSSAQVCATPVDRYGNQISFSAPTWGFVLSNSPFCGTVVDGALPTGIPVPDAAHTYAAGPIFYNITIQLQISGASVGAPILLSAVSNVTGPTFALDTYSPAINVAQPLSNTIGSGIGVPPSCVSPSLWLATDTATAYICNAGAFVPLANGAAYHGFNLRGAWSSSATYQPFDVVSYTDGSSYASLTAANSGYIPNSSTANWVLLAAAGATGGAPPEQLVALPNAVDLFNPLAEHDCQYSANGFYHPAGGCSLNASDPILVTGITSLVASVQTNGGEVQIGNNTSWTNLLGYGSGVPFSLPAGATHLILYTSPTSQLSTVHLYAGTSLPNPAAYTLTLAEGGIVYDVTLSANCTFTITPPAPNGSPQRMTLIIRPNGFTATLPVSGSGLVWKGGSTGSAPVLSTSQTTVLSFVYTGALPIFGGV